MLPVAQHSPVTEPIITPTPTAKTRDSEEGGEDDGGPNVNLIVGAVVGSVGGCGLIIAALCLGIRIGRRRTGPSRNIRERLRALPRPFVSIGLKRPLRTVSSQGVTTIQPEINRGPAKLDANSNQIPTERVVVSGAEGKRQHKLGVEASGRVGDHEYEYNKSYRSICEYNSTCHARSLLRQRHYPIRNDRVITPDALIQLSRYTNRPTANDLQQGVPPVSKQV
jgi:hypothetical protein